MLRHPWLLFTVFSQLFRLRKQSNEISFSHSEVLFYEHPCNELYDYRRWCWFIEGLSKEHSYGWTVWKVLNFVVCNSCQSSPSLTISVPSWLIIISLVFFYLFKVLFSGFLQFNGNFVDGQNNSKYRDCALLITCLCSVNSERLNFCTSLHKFWLSSRVKCSGKRQRQK